MNNGQNFSKFEENYKNTNLKSSTNPKAYCNQILEIKDEEKNLTNNVSNVSKNTHYKQKTKKKMMADFSGKTV